MPRKKLGNATTISKEIQSSSNNSSTEARNSEIISQQNQSLESGDEWLQNLSASAVAYAQQRNETSSIPATSITGPNKHIIFDDNGEAKVTGSNQVSFSNRMVELECGSNGYGFIVTHHEDDDFKYDDTSMQIVNFVPTKEIPSITYIKSVEKGSIAELAKMKPGDHIIEVNGIDVVRSSYSYTLQLMKSSNKKLTLCLNTSFEPQQLTNQQQLARRQPQPPLSQQQPEYRQPLLPFSQQQPAYHQQQPKIRQQQPTYNQQKATYNQQQQAFGLQQLIHHNQPSLGKKASTQVDQKQSTLSSSSVSNFDTSDFPSLASSINMKGGTAPQSQATRALPNVAAIPPNYSNLPSSSPQVSSSPNVQNSKNLISTIKPSFTYKGGHVPKQTLNEVAEQCIVALASDGQLVTVAEIEERLCARFGVDQISTLGVRRIDRDIPRVDQLIRDQRKVNLYCDAFNLVNAIGTLYDLGKNVAKLFDKQDFEDLLLGPLHKQPKLLELFQFPTNAGKVPPITTLNLLQHFEKYMRKNPKGRVPKMKVEDFLKYVQEQYNCENPWELGVQIKSLGLVISSITKARANQSQIVEKFRTQIITEMEDDIKQNLNRIKKSLNDRLLVACGQEGKKHILLLERQQRFAEMDAIDVVVEMFNTVQELFPQNFRRLKLQSFFQSLTMDPVFRKMFQLAVCVGHMDIPDEVDDNSSVITVSDDEDNDISDEYRPTVTDFQAPSPDHLVAAFRDLLEKCQGSVTFQVLSRIEEKLLEKFHATTFSQLSQTTYLAFLLKHAKMVEDYGGSLVSLGGISSLTGSSSNPYKVTREEISHFIQQCGCTKYDDKEMDLLSSALCSHYNVDDIRELGIGSLKRFIKLENNKTSAQKQCGYIHYTTACCVDSRFLPSKGQVGLRGDKTSAEAMRAVANTPLMENVMKWTQWKLVFEPQHGDLKTFIQINANIDAELDLTVLESKPGTLVKISKTATTDKFREAVDSRQPCQAVGQLVSLIVVQYGNIGSVPLALLANNVYQSLSSGCKVETGDKDVDSSDENSVLFVRDCLLIMPEIFHRCLSQQVFMEPLARILGMRESYNKLWQTCMLPWQQYNLEKVGLLLGIQEWCQQIDLKYSCPLETVEDFESVADDEDLITIVTETEEAMDDELGDVAAADDDSTNNAALQKACFTNETLANSDTVEVTIEDDNKEKESETPNIPKEIENQFRAVIERIRHEKFGIGLELNEEGQLLTKGLKELLGRSLDRLSKELYSKETHFVLELIQNADDNEYIIGEKENDLPTAVFIVESDRLMLLNNEKGFSEKNIVAICDVGQTTKGKHKQGYIGQKGIGFKSIFTVTDKPEVHSAGYHICFDAKSGPIGYILPHWLDEDQWPMVPNINVRGVNLQNEKWRTKIVLPLKDRTEQEKHKSRSLTASFRDIHPSLLLFLNRLKSLVVINEITHEKRIISRTDIAKDVIEIKNNQEIERWLVTRKRLRVPESLNPDIESTEIAIAYPLKQREDLIRSRLPKQEVFAFLPLRSFGFNFIVQADFEIPSSRQDIYRDSHWNQFLRDEIPALFIESLSTFKSQPSVSEIEAVRNFLQFVPLDGEVVDFFQPIPKQILGLLRTYECLPVMTMSGIAWKRPSEVVDCKDPVIREVMTNDVLQTHLNMYYLHSDLKGAVTSQLLSSLGVQKLMPNQVIDVFSKICCDNETLFNLSTLAKWLACFCQLLRDDLAHGHDDLLEKIRNLSVYPLSNGRHVSLKSDSVFFPVKDDVKGGRIVHSLQYLYQDLCTINPDIYNTSSEITNSYVKQFLQILGVRDMTPQQIMQGHIIPVLKSDNWKMKSRETLVAYVIFIKQEFDKKPLNINEIKDIIVLSTNQGMVRPTESIVHFSCRYENSIDLLHDFPDYQWIVVDSVYLESLGNDTRKSWRNFLQNFGVVDFLKIKRVVTVLDNEDISLSKWAQYKELLPYGVQKFAVVDFVCDEFDQLVDSWKGKTVHGSNIVQQATRLFSLISSNWFKQYSSFRMARIIDKNDERMLFEMHSSFFTSLRNKAWILSYKVEPQLEHNKIMGLNKTYHLLTADKVFLPMKDIQNLLGIHEHYLSCSEVLGEGRFTEDIDLRYTLSIDEMLNYVKQWSSFDESVHNAAVRDVPSVPFCTTLKHMTAVYHYLSRNVIPDILRDTMNKVPMIFVPDQLCSPDDYVTGTFYRTNDTCWFDPTGLFSSRNLKFVRPDSGKSYKRVALKSFYGNNLEDFFLGELKIYETPTLMEYATLLVNIVAEIDLPSPVGLNDVFRIFEILGSKCMVSELGDNFRDPWIVTLDANYVGPLRERLKDEPIIPSHRNKFVSSTTNPLIPDDAFMADLLKENDEQKLHLVNLDVMKPENGNVLLDQSEKFVMVFLRALGIMKLSSCTEKEHITYNLRSIPPLQHYFSEVVPLLQMFLKSRPHLTSIYEKLCASDIVNTLQLLVCYETSSLEVVLRVTVGSDTVVISKPEKCSLDQKRHFCVHTDYRTSYSVINSELSKLFVSDPKVQVDINNFLSVAKQFVIDGVPGSREEFIKAQMLKPLSANEMVWFVPPPVVPVMKQQSITDFSDAGSINNYEEPSRRKTKKADGDEDDNALRCWPPPRPQGSTQSHENSGGKKPGDSWPKPPPSVLPPRFENIASRVSDRDLANEENFDNNYSEGRKTNENNTLPLPQSKKPRLVGNVNNVNSESIRESDVTSHFAASDSKSPEDNASAAILSSMSSNMDTASVSSMTSISIDSDSSSVQYTSTHVDTALNTVRGAATSTNMDVETNKLNIPFDPINQVQGTTGNALTVPGYVPKFLGHGLSAQQWLQVDPKSVLQNATYIIPESDINSIPLEKLLDNGELMNLVDRMGDEGVSIAVGRWGESWAYQYLRLKYQNEIAAGLMKIIWMNENVTTMAPYDIRVEYKNGLIECVEVKTTTSEDKAVFEVSYEELHMAQEIGPQYLIYRVYLCKQEVKLRIISNVVEMLRKKILKLCMVI